jgi:hypothetical protein
VITLGRGGRTLVLLARCIPARLRDAMLSHRFQLNRLARKPSSAECAPTLEKGRRPRAGRE